MTLFLSRFSRVVLCLLMITVSLAAEAALPRWVRHHPKADNDTYYYVVEDATATSEAAAHNKALGSALQHAIMALGLPYNSKDVENAIATGTLQSMMTEFKIPVHEVCRYRQSLQNGAVRVYILCQVAKAGNIQVEFTEFRHCGDAGDDEAGAVDLRPEEWNYYETDEFFSAFEEIDVEGKVRGEQKDSLEKVAEQALVDDLHLTDSALIDMISVKTQFYKTAGYAVAYISRSAVVDKYDLKIEEELDVCFNYKDNVESYLAEKDPVEAKAVLTRLRDKLAEIEPRLTFLNTYSTSRTVTRYMEDVRELRKYVMDTQNKTVSDTRKAKENKVLEYVTIALDALLKNNVGDALRYLYAAQVVLADVKNSAQVKVEDPNTGNQVPASMYIQDAIKAVLGKVKVTCDGFLPGSDSEIKLSFRYNEQPVTSLTFSYNANMGWSDSFSARDGWSAIFLPENNKPKILQVRLEYRYEDEANFDAELPLLIKKYRSRFNYDKLAQHTVLIEQKTIELAPATTVADSKNSTDMHQNIVANRVEKEEHKVSEVDSTALHSTVMKVCNAIKAKTDTYEALADCFTPEGYKQYNRLIKYGSARVISTDGCRYVKLGDEIQCRSIPMSFTFSKGKNQLENVVFTFNSAGKIDGVQFALEERAARNIMGNTDIDETARLTLVNFMENYKTAFSLQRWDYIESIFSDDAVIITGRVLQKSEQVTDAHQVSLDNVVYTRMSKTEYINRLKRTKKEWINIKFGSTNVEKSMQQNQYGICLLQDYYSSNYGDHGYLFLLIDATDKDRPVIRIRTWQPETAGSTPFTMGDYDRLISGGL